MTAADYDKFLAQQDWQKARRRVLYNEVVCLIKRCSVDLLSFNDVRSDLQMHQQQYLGIKEIPLENIKGSVGRYDDFDAAFMPRKDFLKERWQSVELAVRNGKAPPIDVYQVGNEYFVVDGNHRVSVSRHLGMDTIEAHVTLFTVQEPFGTDANLDKDIISMERTAFLEKSGAGNADEAEEIIFTCAGCYAVISNQIEDYRQGVQQQQNRPVSFEEAFTGWNQEVYAPSIAKIQENNLVDKFPERTEADLYVWTSKNSTELEDLEKSFDT